MTKNKGFTLVELLAVIVILAIILAIAIPGISGIIKSATRGAFESDAKMVLQQLEYEKLRDDSFVVETTSIETISDFNLSNANYEDLRVGIIGNEPYIVIIGKNKWKDLKACGTIKNIALVPIDDTTICEDIPGANPDFDMAQGLNKPELVSGMIPVYYDETETVWKKASQTNVTNNWYNYSTGKWANVVTVTTVTRAAYQSAAVGTTILEADVLTYFVWIPRYKYLIPAGTGAREISVTFEATSTSKSNGDAVATYYTHPAFTFGSEELNGIWVGKFETTGTITAPTIKPDTSSIKSQTVKAMYDSVKTYMQGNVTYGFTNDNDIHMMKNMEWGAVAYLTGSRYGKYGNSSYAGTNKELYMNNSSSYITGRSSGAVSGSGVLTPANGYISAGYYTYDGKCASIYAGLAAPCTTGSAGQTLTDKTLAYGASTTGSIYGIYDMSGGAWEYVMGVYEPNPIPATGIDDASGYSLTTTNSQYNSLTINNKYYDRYLTNLTETGAILGDATKETSGWYGDYANFVCSGAPWFVRGGDCSHGVSAGAWDFDIGSGGVYSNFSFRVVLGPQA